MRQFFCLCMCAALLWSPFAEAQGRETIGVGRLFTNDLFGDGRDRWRTGSAVVSVVRGSGWDGALPGRMGDLIEYRFRAEVIAPANLRTPAPGDRRYAGVLSFGVHTQFQRMNTEFSLGADLVVTGPQSGISDLQTALHDALGIAGASGAVLGAQIGDGIYPTLTLEAGRSFALSDSVSLRPFVELQAGVETLVRAGGDLRIGRLGRDQLLLRDVTTGQRYRVGSSAEPGLSAVLGGDIAYVAQSAYLPSSGGYVLTETRNRLRAGVQWQGTNGSVFYGVTWLGEEFTAQTSSQVVGSLRIDFRF